MCRDQAGLAGAICTGLHKGSACFGQPVAASSAVRPMNQLEDLFQSHAGISRDVIGVKPQLDSDDVLSRWFIVLLFQFRNELQDQLLAVPQMKAVCA